MNKNKRTAQLYFNSKSNTTTGVLNNRKRNFRTRTQEQRNRLGGDK